MLQKFLKKILNRLNFEYTVLRATAYRRKLSNVTFVGITGSAGKTTVKDLTASILSNAGPCSSTLSSRNELFFVAQTILNTKENDKYAVVEIHGGHPGIMDRPLNMVRPMIGVLTHIGHDHFKSFATKEDIANEKRKIVDQLPKHGIAVLNRDDPQIRTIGERCRCRVIWVGKENSSTIQLVESKSVFPEPLTLRVKFNNKIYDVRTRLHGNYLASAVLLSLGVAIAAEMSIESAIDAVAKVLPAEGRMQLVTTDDGVNFIRDDFKAPYWSIKEPVEFLSNANAPRKIAVFGTVSDYSRSASKVYKQLAEFACTKVDIVIFVGPHALRALKAKHSEIDDSLRVFPEIRDAASYLKNELRRGDLVLLKGSNKVDHLERLFLDRNQDVTCWTSHCRLMRFCQNCELVHADSSIRGPSAGSLEEMCIPLEPSDPENRLADIIVIGLGNPGAQYENTPHNVGHRALETLRDGKQGRWESGPEGNVCELKKSGSTLLLFKPSAEVNISGSAVRKFVKRHGCTHKGCILIHDDMDLPLGQVKWKSDGGDGGHKGVRSVIMALGTGKLLRIRIGMKPPPGEVSKRRYVLRKFDGETEVAVQGACQQAGQMIEQKLVEMTMSRNKSHNHEANT